MPPLRVAVFSTSLAAGATAAAPALAQGAGGREGWRFAVSPYVWIAGSSGTVNAPLQRLPQQDVSVGFGDVLSNLSGFAFTGAGEIHYAPGR